MMEDNSRFLVRTTVEKLFRPTLRSGVLGALSPIWNCLLLGYFLGSEAMVVACLFFPIYTMWNVCNYGIGIGGTSIFSRYQGAGNLTKANEIFHKALWLAVAAGLLCGLLPLVNAAWYVDLLGASEEILALAVYQSRWVCLATLFNMLYWVLYFFVRSDSNPGLAAKGAVVDAVVEGVADWLFLFVFKLGIASVALGMMSGYLAGSLVLLTHFRSPESSLTLGFVRPALLDIKEFFHNSVSDTIGQFVLSIANIIFNNLILEYLGINIMAVWAVLTPCQCVDQGFIAGVNNAYVPILSTFYVEKNSNAVYITMQNGFRRLLMVSAAEVAVYFLFTTQIAALFGSGLGEMQYTCFIALRSYAVCLPFAFFNIFVISVLQATGHTPLAAALSIIRSLLFQLFFGIWAIVTVNAYAFWFTYLFSELAVTFLIVFGFPIMEVNKGSGLSLREYFDFANNYKGELNMLLTGSFAELQGYQDLAQTFLEHQGQGDKVFKVSLIMEEVLRYLISQGFNAREGNYVDYNLYIRADNSLFMRVRSNSKYLKLSKMQELAGKAGAGDLLELRMLIGLADKVTTSKVNGLNSIALEI